MRKQWCSSYTEGVIMAWQNTIGDGANSLTATSITAAGTTQATATILLAQDNEVTTVASGAGVVVTNLLLPGENMTVFNAGANAVKVYPPTGVQINALGSNNGFSLSPNTGVMLRMVSTSRIFGVLSA